MGKKLWTIEKVRIRLAEIHPDMELMQDFYINNTTKMKLKCKVCGNLFEMHWSALQEGCSCPACNRKRQSDSYKVSLEDMILEVEKLNPSVIVLNEEYEGNTISPIRCKCKIDGYLWQTTMQSVRELKKCPRCSGHGKLTIEVMKREVEQLNPEIEVMNETYEGSSDKVICKCKIDGYIWGTTLRQLKKNPKCQVCQGYEKMILVKQELFLINPNVEIIDDLYIKGNGKLTCRCLIDGNIWISCWSTLKRSIGCRSCAARKLGDSKRFTMEYVRTELSRVRPDIELIEENYIDCNTKMECFCKICETTFFANYESLIHLKGCANCALLNKSGENSIHWKGGISTLNEYLRDRILDWKNDSKKDCNYKCVVTGGKFKAVHHKYSFNTIVQDMLKIEPFPIYQEINQYTKEELEKISALCLKLHYEHGLGVCVSGEIHNEFHTLFGTGDNTPEQWQEFLKIKGIAA